MKLFVSFCAGALMLIPLLAFAPKSTQDGVFSEAQSKRGETLYSEECAKCHGPSLGGGDAFPELIGESFQAHWNHRTAGDFIGFMRATMPTDGPGRLTAQQYSDLGAFILSVNGFPAGKTELGKEMADLNAIAIEWKN